MEEIIKQRRSGSRFIKWVLIILLLSIFLIILCFFLLKMAGVDPVNEAKQLLAGGSSDSVTQSDHTLNKQITELKRQLEEKDAAISRLTNENETKSNQIADLTGRLQQSETSSQANIPTQTEEDREAVYAQTYKYMDPKKAASIFDQLTADQAAEYINMLDNKTKAAILENMSVAKAAALTPLLKANHSSGSNVSGSAAGSSSP